MLMNVPSRNELKPGPLTFAVRDLPLLLLVYLTTRWPVIVALKLVGVSSKIVMYSLLTTAVTVPSNKRSPFAVKQANGIEGGNCSAIRWGWLAATLTPLSIEHSKGDRSGDQTPHGAT